MGEEITNSPQSSAKNSGNMPARKSVPTPTEISELQPDAAVAFLTEAARYFEKRPTGGEDAAHWSNVTNAENCRKVAALIAAQSERIEGLEKYVRHDGLCAIIGGYGYCSCGLDAVRLATT